MRGSEIKMGYENRDIECASDVGRMAELNRFAKEIVVYGSACTGSDGKIYYYATKNEEKLYNFVQQQQLNQQCVTPIVYKKIRCKIPKELEEEFLQKIKLSLLQYMKKQYEPEYFSSMIPFFQKEANDEGSVLLEEYQHSIEGHFDDTELQLFQGALQKGFVGKIISRASYDTFQNWYQEVRSQMADDPIAESNIKRTFYGFVYWDNTGKQKLFFDAQRMEVVHRQLVICLQGALVGPILQKTYYFQQFNQINQVRQNYKEWLLQAQDEAYFQILKELKRQVGVIDFEQLNLLEKSLMNKVDAHKAFLYYKSIWNQR